MTMPVKIMHSGLTNTIYAVRRYSARPGGLFVAAAGAKDDVTQEAIAAVLQHVSEGCKRTDCLCRHVQVHMICGVIYPVPEAGKVVKHCELEPRHDGQHADGQGNWW